MATAVLDTNEVQPSVLCILDHSGDTRMQWNRNKDEEVSAAELKFQEYKKKGYLAYRVDKKGTKGEVLDKFDPNAERIILHEQMIGG